MLTVRRATEKDALDLAKRLRADDLRELQAVGRASPEEALLLGVSSPDPCYVAVDEEDVPHIIFGTYPSEEHFVGYVWMMASDAIRTYREQVLRETRPWVSQIRGHYRLLTNAVHADNKVHIRWLKWAGFTFLREFTFNENRFFEFAKLIQAEDR